MQFQVKARQFVTDVEQVVYTTAERENASAYAESHFIRQHAYLTRACDQRGRNLTDRDGREYIWERQH